MKADMAGEQMLNEVYHDILYYVSKLSEHWSELLSA